MIIWDFPKSTLAIFHCFIEHSRPSSSVHIYLKLIPLLHFFKLSRGSGTRLRTEWHDHHSAQVPPRRSWPSAPEIDWRELQGLWERDPLLPENPTHRLQDKTQVQRRVRYLHQHGFWNSHQAESNRDTRAWRNDPVLLLLLQMGRSLVNWSQTIKQEDYSVL